MTPRSRSVRGSPGRRVARSARGQSGSTARRPAAILVPGFGADANQPLLVELARRVRRLGIVARRVSLGGGRVAAPYEAQLDALRAVRARLERAGHGPLALVGRSFGGRMCAFLAAAEPPAALVILGHPLRPHGKRRPADEAALRALRCPTLVIQGDRDELGPLHLLRALARGNRHLEVRVLEDTGHAFGKRTDEALAHCAAWLGRRLAREVGGGDGRCTLPSRPTRRRAAEGTGRPGARRQRSRSR